MDVFTSNPLDLPRSTSASSRARDLIFYGVTHRGESYEARVFVDHPDADISTPRELDAGLCRVVHGLRARRLLRRSGPLRPERPEPDAFDVRPPHPMTPWTKVVIATDAIRRATADTSGHGRPVAVGRASPRISDAMGFQSLKLALYAARYFPGASRLLQRGAPSTGPTKQLEDAR